MAMAKKPKDTKRQWIDNPPTKKEFTKADGVIDLRGYNLAMEFYRKVR